MRQALWVIGFVAVGCGKKSEQPPKPGSASAAVVPVIDAPPSEDPPDIDAPAATGSLDAIPADGILLATNTRSEIVIAKLDRAGLAVVHKVPVKSDTAEFAWLDDKTLAVHDTADDKPVVIRYVDGVEKGRASFGDKWEHATMFVTKSGEAWLERCTVEMEGPEPCTKLEYVRAVPQGKPTKKKPKDVDAWRVGGGYWGRGLQRATPDVPAPAGMSLEKVKFTVKDDTGTQDVVGVKCTAGAETSTYPEKDGYDTAYGYTAKTFRWVLADPPIYEVAADTMNPVGQNEQPVDYFIACKQDALDGFVGLGGPVWAQYADDKDVSGELGTWTFRVGKTDVGTLVGGAVRANR
jgi:hypothetical protein